jgi:hypothetical protein
MIYVTKNFVQRHGFYHNFFNNINYILRGKFFRGYIVEQ